MRLPSAADADELHHQIIADTIFLRKLGVVDYSLLVGVRRGVSMCEGPEHEHGQLTYEVAIIDTLTKFGNGPALQKACSKYAADFMRLVTSIVQ